MTNHPNRTKGYKRHAMGKFKRTLCGLAVEQPKKHELELAQFPSGITCKNCLALYYSEAT